MDSKIKIGISSCLLGEKVRYDGQHKLDRYLKDTLGQYVNWVSVCPEVECGLSIPREAMSLKGTVENPQLISIKSGINLTEQMNSWINGKLIKLSSEKLAGFILKKKSPSSALSDAKIHNISGIPFAKSPGLFAKAFINKFPLIPVEDEGRLHDSVLRENFIERVFIYSRWLENSEENSHGNFLSEFHKKHKLIIMSHAPSETSKLGKLASSAPKDINADLLSKYITTLMPLLKKRATVKKHVNVLHHIMGYFKKDLTSSEKKELLTIIEEYYNCLIPLIVPLTMLKHYINKYDKSYLKEQYYIYQHPSELKLRNHV